MDDLEQKLSTQVRTMQIIIAATVVVPLIFAGVVMVIGAQTPERPAPIQGAEPAPAAQGQLVVERLALGAGLVSIFLQQLMGRHVRGQAVKNLARQAMSEPERLGDAYLTGLVVSAAINEMAAFLNLIAFMNSQSWFNFGMALLLIASNATKMPTCAKVAAWARAKHEALVGQA